ncbi:MAG: 2Fe-2S iron-sulfur cluster binding domain-containing protein [Rhodospirillales bacterium]|nr:2Fe-2S iron-sulfur cluster binding domain-containing protein [Rhodospirillales bacterium]
MNLTLLTRDEVRLQIAATAGQSALEAAEAAGLYPAAMCRDGQCGQCAAHVVSGTYEMGPHSPAALPPEPGGVLLCRCLPASDLTVVLPYGDAQLPRHSVPVRQAVIETLHPAGAAAMSLVLRLQPDAALGQTADFLPGQYMELRPPGMAISRAYSLANLPNWDGALEFLIRLVPGGAFSGWLAQVAKPGDRLELRGPLGQFTLDEASPRARWLVGGGCGFAPLLSLLRQMAEFQDTTPVRLIYGVNVAEELLPNDMFAPLQDALPQLHITFAVWRGAPGANAVQGSTAEILENLLASTETPPDIYVCGPPKMVETVLGAARRAGVPEAQLFCEKL